MIKSFINLEENIILLLCAREERGELLLLRPPLPPPLPLPPLLPLPFPLLHRRRPREARSDHPARKMFGQVIGQAKERDIWWESVIREGHGLVKAVVISYRSVGGGRFFLLPDRGHILRPAERKEFDQGLCLGIAAGIFTGIKLLARRGTDIF